MIRKKDFTIYQTIIPYKYVYIHVYIHVYMHISIFFPTVHQWKKNNKNDEIKLNTISLTFTLMSVVWSSGMSKVVSDDSSDCFVR